MDIGEPLKELGVVAMQPLLQAITNLPPEAWLENEQRQQDYDVHRRTESIVLLFTDGAGWPDIVVTRESGWDLLGEAALPLMNSIIRDHYPPGGTIIRAMAAKLLPGELISPHRDSHPSFHHGHRIHLPMTSNPRVRFIIDGRPCRMQVGEAYEINNQKAHSVMNKGNDARINFIFDYVPPDRIAGNDRPL
ncbi:MAG: hypothetical protein ACI8QT_001051 [Halioglobus sp.]|jgi:hypothetical protein